MVSISSPTTAATKDTDVSVEEISNEADAELIVENEKIEERIDTFLRVCGENTSEDDLPPTPDYSCSLEAEALAPILDKLEEEGTLAPSEETTPNCSEHPSVMPSSIITNFKEDLTDELQCRKEDVEYYEQSCGEEFQCNMIRAGLAASKAFPSVIESPIRGYLLKKTSGASDTKHCIDDSRSNCLTEVWTALVGNIMDTMNSLWELAKIGWNSLWNLSDFFDRKSDELQVAASQRKEDVVSFWHSPGEWIYKKFNGLKEGVEDWMKESVFCQEWQGTPHMPDSKCVRPLETFGCINCGDMTNAFCAAAGVVVSELGLVVATAGAGTAAGIVAHMGVKAAGKAALKVSAKVASVAPKMTKLSKASSKTGKVSKLTTKAKVVAEAAVEASRVVVRVSSEKIAHAKELIVKYKDGILNSRAAQVTLKAVDIASAPMIVLDKAAEVGIIASERLMSRIVPGTTGRFLRRRALIRQITPETDVLARTRDRLKFTLRHQARGARTVSTYEQKPKRGRNSGHDDSHTGRRDSPDHQRDPKRDPKLSDASDSLTGQHNQNSGNRRNPEADDRLRVEQEKRNQRTAEQRNESGQQLGSDQHHQPEQNKDSRATDHAIGRKMVLADAALKASGIGSRQTPEEMVAEANRLVRDSQGGDVSKPAQISSREEAMKALSGDQSSSNSQSQSMSQAQAKAQYQKLKSTYSQGNRQNYVNSMSRATGLDPSVAANYFDRRQQEVESAGKLLFPEESSKTRKKKAMISDLSKELEGLDDQMDSLNDSFERDRQEERVRDQQAAENKREDLTDEFNERRTVASATPSATPTVASSNASGFNGTTNAVGAAASAGNGGNPNSASAQTQSHESSHREALQSAGLLETMNDGDSRILEGLIKVDALHLIKGSPSEIADLKKNFGDELGDIQAHGKIRSSKGEFLFLQTAGGFLVFKKKASLWVKVESTSLESLLKKKAVASR